LAGARQSEESPKRLMASDVHRPQACTMPPGIPTTAHAARFLDFPRRHAPVLMVMIRINVTSNFPNVPWGSI
jgi:hypothetical protein